MTTSLAEVRQQVADLTARPDRKDAIDVAINNICRKLGGTGRYSQALSEYAYDPTQYLATGSTTLLSIPLPARFDGIAYIKLKDSCPLDQLHPETSKEKVLGRGWYVSGGNILVNSGWNGAEVTSLLAGFYLYPSRLTLDEDTNWVLDRFEHLIIDHAASYTLNAIGDQTSARALLTYAAAFQPSEIAAAAELSED